LIKTLIQFLVAVLISVFSSPWHSQEPTRTEKNYVSQELHGWTVMISKDVAKDKQLYQRLIKQVNKDLLAIKSEMPVDAIPTLQQTTVWFEKRMPKPMGNNLFFNGSKKLSQKYQISHLYGGVVAGSSKAYLAVAHIHPWQLLHELTHAYHQFTIKHSYAPIINAYENALESNLHRFGNQYARKNKKEYFSTLTEAYFGKDANYPHNKKELADHDPKGYCAIVQAWGLLNQQEENAPLKCN